MQSQHIYSRDVVLILIASFFYMASSMLVTPLITGFAGSLGAGGVLMGLVGGLSNFCSLMCRPAWPSWGAWPCTPCSTTSGSGFLPFGSVSKMKKLRLAGMDAR